MSSGHADLEGSIGGHAGSSVASAVFGVIASLILMVQEVFTVAFEASRIIPSLHLLLSVDLTVAWEEFTIASELG